MDGRTGIGMPIQIRTDPEKVPVGTVFYFAPETYIKAWLQCNRQRIINRTYCLILSVLITVLYSLLYVTRVNDVLLSNRLRSN